MLDEKNFKKNFAKSISKLRKDNGMTQQELAAALNYSDKAISKWEREESVPDTFTVYKIAKLFKIPISELFGETQAQQPQEELEQQTRNYMRPIKIFVPVISCLAVFFMFSIAFFILFNTKSTEDYAYYAFLFAVPIASLVLTIFSALWWKLRYSCIFTSIIIWSVGIAFFVTLQMQAVWFVFVPCFILQVLCILVYIFIYYLQKAKT